MVCREKAAEILGFHKGTLPRWIKDGHIRAYRLPGGGEIRIKHSDLLASLEAIESLGERDDGEARTRKAR